jgi:hypothetical protein
MMRHIALAVIVAGGFVACESNAPYQPINKPEEMEYKQARLEVYPEDVRKDLDHYTNTTVAWVGVIRSTEAQEDDTGGGISAQSVFDHHYFDWDQDTDPALNLLVSPRGEGEFACHWVLRKKNNDGSAYDAEKFARQGKLAIVYGVPESVMPDGTVVLRYHYLRVIPRSQFVTNSVSYGRLGEDLSKPMGDHVRSGGSQ